MADDSWMPLAREPSAEEFEAADAEQAQRGVQAVVFRTLWRLVALVTVVALVAYLVVPFGGFVGSSLYHRWHPTNPMRSIPLAPRRTSPPAQPV